MLNQVSSLSHIEKNYVSFVEEEVPVSEKFLHPSKPLC